MKRFVVAASYLILLGFVASGCGDDVSNISTTASLKPGQEQDCSKAKAHSAGNFLYEYLHAYRSFTRDEMLENTNYGVEVTEEARKSFDPLNGTGLDKRLTCSRAFKLEGQRKTYLEANRVPGSYLIQSIQEGNQYIVFSGQTPSSDTEIVLLQTQNGLRKVLATEPTPKGGCSAALGSYSSPEGAHIAVIRHFSQCGLEQPTSEDITLKLFDANGDLVSAPYSGTFTPGVNVYWQSESTYELKDDNGSVTFEVP